MTFRKTVTVSLAASAAVQNIVIPDVFGGGSPQGIVAINATEWTKLPDAGPVWLGIDTATPTNGGDDTTLIPDGSPYALIYVGSMKFRELQRPNWPDIVIPAIYPSGGIIEVACY